MRTLTQKQLVGIHAGSRPHWVGNGFPVRTLFSYHQYDQLISPFLLFDYAGPHQFDRTTERRGVGSHPHRGFETVTIVYSGEVSHQDSAGGGGTIGTGDVQWMTAGCGILHEEFHSEEYAAKGGDFEMVQLWVNLPAKDKMTPPRYQSITDQSIPVIPLDDESGQIRVISGQYAMKAGAAQTFSEVNVWDVQLKANRDLAVEVQEGHSLIVVALQGDLKLNGDHTLPAAQVAIFSHQGETISIQATVDAKFLILSGEPLNEAIEGYGPFVMNNKQQIKQAIDDFNHGEFGQIANEIDTFA